MTQPTIDSVRKAVSQAAKRVDALAQSSQDAADAATAKRDETKAPS